MMLVFVFKQKTAYELRISDWISDACSSDLLDRARRRALGGQLARRHPLAAVVVEHIIVVAHRACLSVDGCRLSRPYGRKKGRSIAARPPPDGRPKATPPADPSRAAPRSPPPACPARPDKCRRAAHRP